jgi:hypothetical protein
MSRPTKPIPTANEPDAAPAPAPPKARLKDAPRCFFRASLRLDPEPWTHCPAMVEIIASDAYEHEILELHGPGWEKFDVGGMYSVWVRVLD